MNNTDFISNIENLPKIDLHCHLDGSIRPNTAYEIIRSQNLNLELNIDVNSDDIDKKNNAISIIEKKIKVSDKCSSLNEYLEKFEIPVRILQTYGSLERCAFEVFEDSYMEGIAYLELRFAPSLHTKNMTIFEVIRAVIDGMNRAKQTYPIDGNIILCCMKNQSEELAIEVINSGREFLNRGVVAIDLAGPEDEGFSNKFINSMRLAKNYGYKLSIHAGEAASGKNVLDAIILLNADRIGHGIRTLDNSEALDVVRFNNILLEICPSSNIQTNNVESINKHPIKYYLENGFNISINTDNRTVSNTNITNEIRLVSDLLKLDYKKYKKIYTNTVNASFANDSIKKKLLLKI